MDILVPDNEKATQLTKIPENLVRIPDTTVDFVLFFFDFDRFEVIEILKTKLSALSFN